MSSGLNLEVMGFIVNPEHPCIQHSHQVCSFRILNGTFLILLNLAGLTLNLLEVYFLLMKIKLPANQNVFLLNVSVGDTAMSLTGLIRGAGMLSTWVIGVDPASGHVTQLCAAYEILIQVASNCGMLILLPLTIDRYLAVVTPMRHRYGMTKGFSKAMCVACWIPILIMLCYDVVSYTILHNLKIQYDPGYLRCVRVDSYVVQSFTIITPFCLIVLMYLVIIFKITRNNLQSRQILATSTIIIFAAIIAYFPSCIANLFDIPMGYEFAQILTISMYYSCNVVNPLVYFCLHPRAKMALGMWLRRNRGTGDNELTNINQNHSSRQ